MLRKAPAVSKRVTARKSFFPLVPDETHEGMEARRDAYLRCWRDTDAHIESVLREANQDAFEKLTGFVRGGFERRQALVAANHGTLPQHAAQRIPVGLVLAGGVNSDDHEETFSKLTAHLRRVGCHTALLRSRDLKARGGGAAAAAAAVAAADAREGGGGGGEDAGAAAAYVGSASGGSAGGGLGVAIRRILEQLRAGAARDAAGASSHLRVSGRSARHLKRWYREVTEPFPRGPPHVNHTHSVAVPTTPEVDKLYANARSDALDDSAGVRLDGNGSAAVSLAAGERSGDRRGSSFLSPPAPVAIVVEDTEGFDARVLGDLLLALSDASDELPVTVLLGVATSANTVHGMLPAATAARLDARAFKLYSPKNVMAAVQTRVLMDPGLVPALSNAALELLATRFKEHDFSLSAARRAVHLLTLEHFMYQPLAAAAPAAAAAAEAAAEAERAERAEHRRALVHDHVHERRDRDRDRDPDGLKFDSGKESDSAEEALFCLEDVARDVARDDEAINAADSAADAAVVDALAARSARVAAAASRAASAAAESAADTWLTPKSLQWAKKHLGLGSREEVTRALRDAFPKRKRWGLALRCVSAAAAACGVQKGELSELFVDASSAKFWTTDESAQGQSLLRLICARLERDDTSVFRVRALCRRWARLCALEPTIYGERGGDLKKIAALCDDALAAAAADGDADRDRDRDRDRDPERHPEEHPEREKDAAARDVAEDEKVCDVAEEGGEGEDPELFAATPAPAKKNKNAESVVSPRPPSSRARRRASARVSTPATVSTPAAVDADAPTDAVAEPVVDLTSPDGARAVAAALVARRRAGPERARALELAAAARGKRRREDRDVSSRDVRVSEKDRDRRTAGDNSDATETTAPSSPEMEFSRAARRAACAFLKAVASAHASGPPCSLPGMELFCVTSTSRLREAVQAAPRLVLEQQMAHPQPFLKCGCCPPGGGASATLPDCCAAYTLLQDAGDAANVHEWFRAFCEMHAGSLGTKAKKNRSNARRGPPPEAPADEPRDDDDEAGEDAGEPRRNGKETFSLEKRKLWELQARFTRAAAELEFLGVARPVKRRKVEYMQRTAFPLDQLLGDDGR